MSGETMMIAFGIFQVSAISIILTIHFFVKRRNKMKSLTETYKVGFMYGKESGAIYQAETGRTILTMNEKNWQDPIEKYAKEICEYLNNKYYVEA